MRQPQHNTSICSPGIRYRNSNRKWSGSPRAPTGAHGIQFVIMTGGRKCKTVSPEQGDVGLSEAVNNGQIDKILLTEWEDVIDTQGYTAQSSIPPPKPPRLPSPLAIRDSTRSSGRPNDRPRALPVPKSSFAHHPLLSSSSSLSSLPGSASLLYLPLPFPLRFFTLLEPFFSNPRPEPPPRSLP
jgi:hypothetical protein